MSRRRKRQAPLPLHDMSQAKRREFAIFPSRSDSSEPPPGTCSETVFEISDSASATTTAYEQPHSSPQANVVHNRHEIAWKVPIVTCSQIPVEQGWFCIGIININLEGCSNASYILSTDTLHFGWTVGGELFVEAGTGETAVWLEGRPANADTHLLRSAESLNYLVVRQNLAQVCLVDVSPPFIALGVLVSEMQLDTSAEFPRGVARLITEHFGNLVKALYAEVTWPGQLSSSKYAAKLRGLSYGVRAVLFLGEVHYQPMHEILGFGMHQYVHTQDYVSSAYPLPGNNIHPSLHPTSMLPLCVFYLAAPNVICSAMPILSILVQHRLYTPPALLHTGHTTCTTSHWAHHLHYFTLGTPPALLHIGHTTYTTSHWAHHLHYFTLGTPPTLLHIGYTTCTTSHWAHHLHYFTLGTPPALLHIGHTTCTTSHWAHHLHYFTLGTPPALLHIRHTTCTTSHWAHKGHCTTHTASTCACS